MIDRLMVFVQSESESTANIGLYRVSRLLVDPVCFVHRIHKALVSELLFRGHVRHVDIQTTSTDKMVLKGNEIYED